MIEMFLCSYFAGAATLFEDFAEQNIRAKEVLFIPTATNVEEYRDYVDEAKEAFAKMGFEVQILDVSKASEVEAKAKIGAARVLYVSGGNTFYLLRELKKKDLVGLIAKRVQSGELVYVGESAGAMIAAPSVEYAAMMDDAGDYGAAAQTGLYLVKFYPVPHYGEEPFVQSTAKILKAYGGKLNLVPINNAEAIAVHGDKFEILGR
ncbi:Type 1 glutamine amidotransferase-like domain-containing protein [uncultured Campylobacter sp.]|uniref:Type 1 glutamine amidotransferase-like domain-containing protein n=1 Tax=uncultured Campylobacter sp. TaxID=218934 RepID=UPI0026016F19|nr:Type 1 glutamine amidotransferase-like domain-containing protein [uncultured Campylobacter sp.]